MKLPLSRRLRVSLQKTNGLKTTLIGRRYLRANIENLPELLQRFPGDMGWVTHVVELCDLAISHAEDQLEDLEALKYLELRFLKSNRRDRPYSDQKTGHAEAAIKAMVRVDGEVKALRERIFKMKQKRATLKALQKGMDAKKESMRSLAMMFNDEFKNAGFSARKRRRNGA